MQNVYYFHVKIYKSTFSFLAEATFDEALPIKTKSRLSKELLEILHDNAALAYFIQYMDARKAKHLVKFWLEAESFRISSETKQKFFEAKPSSDSVATDDVFQSSSQNSNCGRPEDFRSSDDSKTLNSDCWNYASTDSSDPLKNAQDCKISPGLPNVVSNVYNSKTPNSRNIDTSNEVKSSSNCENSASAVHSNPVPHADSSSNPSIYRNSSGLDNSNSAITDTNITCDSLSVDQRDKPLEQSSSVDSGCEIRSKDSIPSVEALNDGDAGEIEGNLKGKAQPFLFFQVISTV